MTKYSEQGYGIIIGEYAVLTNGGDVKKALTSLLTTSLTTVTPTASVPFLWDCSDFFSRSELKMRGETKRYLMKDAVITSPR